MPLLSTLEFCSAEGGGVLSYQEIQGQWENGINGKSYQRMTHVILLRNSTENAEIYIGRNNKITD